jgi:ABC-type nickel/cobalt efflux system permease component RcnA
MLALMLGVTAGSGFESFAHPLGNFTINHFSRIRVDRGSAQIHAVVDMAEIPTFQELQTIDTNGDDKASETELNDYLSRAAASLANQMMLTVDGAHVPLMLLGQNAKLSMGAGGLATLRIELDLEGRYSDSGEARTLGFEDRTYSDRIGWREIVVAPASGVTIFNSSAYANGLSDELRSYPAGLLAAPLDERSAQLSFSSGAAPAGVRRLSARDGRVAQAPTRDRLAELIAVPQLTPGLVLAGLLFAMILGAMHALSPGHGKTVVGAYLVGSRGTARHAAFLGLTVTITHTAGVFALGLITLLASEYVVPERLFPVLSLISGGLVAVIGLSLFLRRLRGAVVSNVAHEHGHSDDDDHHHGTSAGCRCHDHGGTSAGCRCHGHHHHDADPRLPHSHGGKVHSHLPPGADGSRVTWKSLLALGISGGILPCPSALVVLLAAISLHRVGYGLLLVFFFSIGLAGVLTAVGLIFVYAKRLLKSAGAFGRLAKVLPIASAFVITCAGLAICYEALSQAGIDPFTAAVGLWSKVSSAAAAPQFASIGGLGILGLGLVYGLKHATEADHIVAVSTIVSEHRRLGRAAAVGALWGVGHTASLVVVGSIVLALKVAIPESVAHWLEFTVALMIISLGAIALRRALGRRSSFHLHRHDHNGLRVHSHIHFHETSEASGATAHTHDIIRIGIKPTIVGAVHGLAGSAALTLLVLTQINSPVLGLLYLGVFGTGSILGMLLMSGLVGLPFVFGSRKLNGVHYSLQMIAATMSITFGIWYAYVTGFASSQ